MIVVVATRNPLSAFHLTMLLDGLGYSALAVRESAPLLGCILDARAGLLLIEDGFVPKTSAHSLINHIRSLPGPKSSIPVLRVWKGPVAASGPDAHSVLTISAPVTGTALEQAIQRMGLRKGN